VTAGRRSGLVRWTRRLGVLSLALGAGGPLAAFAGLAAPLAGFLLLALGALLGLAATIAGLVALARGGGGAAAAGLAPGLAVVATVLVLGAGAREYPRINDITTDTERPPAFVHAPALAANAGRDLDYPGETFARAQRAGYGELAPLRLALPPDEAFARVRRAAAAMEGWTLTREDAAARAVEGVDTSRLFRFQDDFVIEVRPAEDGGAVVHMRSKSRDGRGDLGANARRIRAFLARVAETP
jgi:uncharacterized protein (DUF1499 family)